MNKIIFLSNSYLSLELLKYWCISKKVSTPSIHSLVGSGYVILKKKYLSFKRSWYPILIVWNTSAFLTFLTYRFYILLNLTILFFYILFFWNVWFDLFCQPCVPLNFYSIFFLSFVWIFSFKRKAGCFLTIALKSAF